MSSPPPLPKDSKIKGLKSAEMHLKTLGILHFACAATLFALIPVFIWMTGWFGRLSEAHQQSMGEYAEMYVIMFQGLILILWMTAFFSMLHGGLYVRGGLWLFQRRRRQGILVIALMNVLYFPLGTMLSAYTYWALNQVSVKALFPPDRKKK